MSTQQIDLGLSRYYKRYQVEYYEDKDDDQSGKFMKWCNDNGYDTDGIRDELENEPSECALTKKIFHPQKLIKKREIKKYLGSLNIALNPVKHF